MPSRRPTLTPHQVDAVEHMVARSQPGIHVLQGPHGCGKNVVALHAAFRRARETERPVLLFVSYQTLFQWVDQLREWFSRSEFRWKLVRRTKLEELAHESDVDVWICTNTLFSRVQPILDDRWSTVAFDAYKGSVAHVLRSFLQAERVHVNLTLWTLTSDPDLLPVEEVIWFAFVNASAPIPPIYVIVLSSERVSPRSIVPLVWSYDVRSVPYTEPRSIECPICLEENVVTFIECHHCHQTVCDTCYTKMIEHARPACPFCRSTPTWECPWTRWCRSHSESYPSLPTMRGVIDDVLAAEDRRLVIVFENQDDPLFLTLSQYVPESAWVLMRGPSDRVRADVRAFRHGKRKIAAFFSGHPVEQGFDLVFTLDLSFATDVIFVGDDSGALSTEFTYGNEMHAYACVHRQNPRVSFADRSFPRLYRVPTSVLDEDLSDDDEEDSFLLTIRTELEDGTSDDERELFVYL